MIKELFLTASALTSMGVPVRSSQVRSNEQETTIVEEQGYSVIENGMKIHYKYETNDVNSENDLVVGRAYHISVNDTTIDELFMPSQNGSINLLFFNINYYDFHYYSFRVEEYITSSNASNGLLSLLISFTTNETYFDFYLTNNNDNDYFTELVLSVSLDEYNFSLDGDFILKESSIGYYINSTEDAFISKCENIPIDYVERVYPTNLMGNIASFIDDYLLSGIPLIDSVTGSINGTNVTMRAWLCSMICIVIACLLIWLAIIFIKWLFKLMSGCFNRL